MTDNSVKQIIFVKEVYKKNPWFIPIERVGDKYVTGQDELTTSQKLGQTPLTDELREKYPFVINPEDQHQINHLQKLNLNDSYWKAIYDLIIASRQVAESEEAYKQNTIRYVGFFFDKELDAKMQNTKEDSVFEAQQLIRAASLEEHRRIGTLLNYLVKGSFYIPVQSSSPDMLKNRLIKACYDHTEEIKKCFPKYNKGIEKFMFILELLDYDIIRETERGEFFYETEPLGSSIDEVISKFARYEGREMKRLLEMKLQKAKQGLPVDEREDVNTFISRIKELKVLYVDGRLDDLKEGLLRLNADFPELCSDHRFADDMDRLESLVKPKQDNPKKTIEPEPTEKDLSEEEKKIRSKLEKKDLEGLQASVKHHMTPYDKEECVDFWDDRDALLEYMVQKQLSNAD